MGKPLRVFPGGREFWNRLFQETNNFVRRDFGSGLDDAVAYDVRHHFGNRVYPELFHDTGAMGFDGLESNSLAVFDFPGVAAQEESAKSAAADQGVTLEQQRLEKRKRVQIRRASGAGW